MNENPSAGSWMRSAEIIFEVTEAVESGYDARTLGYGIYGGWPKFAPTSWP